MENSKSSINFNKFSDEEKRYIFMLMDIKMKQLHQYNQMVLSFKPEDIYYENGMIHYAKTRNIDATIADSKEEAIMYNIFELSALAFSAYALGSNMDGVLNRRVIKEQFDNFSHRINEEDLPYYRSILVDGVLPDNKYYYDYVKTKENSNSSKGQSTALVKATEAGRLMTDKDEAAFGDTFFFVTIATAMLIGTISLIIFFLK